MALTAPEEDISEPTASEPEDPTLDEGGDGEIDA